jgi:hypothetical protein
MTSKAIKVLPQKESKVGGRQHVLVPFLCAQGQPRCSSDRGASDWGRRRRRRRRDAAHAHIFVELDLPRQQSRRPSGRAPLYSRHGPCAGVSHPTRRELGLARQVADAAVSLFPLSCFPALTRM